MVSFFFFLCFFHCHTWTSQCFLLLPDRWDKCELTHHLLVFSRLFVWHGFNIQPQTSVSSCGAVGLYVRFLTKFSKCSRIASVCFGIHRWRPMLDSGHRAEYELTAAHQQAGEALRHCCASVGFILLAIGSKDLWLACSKEESQQFKSLPLTLWSHTFTDPEQLLETIKPHRPPHAHFCLVGKGCSETRVSTDRFAQFVAGEEVFVLFSQTTALVHSPYVWPVNQYTLLLKEKSL